MVKRRVEAITSGHVSFEERFPGKRRRLDEGLPPLAPWRSNLTALSQERNLYFVAYGASIYVYEPEFPEQRIQEPVLIIESQPSEPDLRGYLDADEPHAINNLLVQKLGKDEVVATVRDDGDVEVLLVRHIVHSISTRLKVQNNADPVADNVKPIFQQNVGISAWGLAIHTQSRILAVSSNKHEVTVFRFGLVSEPETPRAARRRALLERTVGAQEYAAPAESSESQSQRLNDVTCQVVNGQANIPHVAFCNTGDDPTGRWLITTDISGVCRAMDLRPFVLVQAYRFGPSFATPMLTGGYDRLNAGWGIMFLDTRSFIPEDTFEGALGMDDDDILPDLKSDARIWDLSRTLRHVGDNSEAFSDAKARQRAAQSRSLSRTSAMDGDTTTSSPSMVPTIEDSSTTTEDAVEQEEEAGGVALAGFDGEPESGEAAPAASNTEPPVDEELDTGPSDLWDDLDLSDEPSEDTMSASTFYNGERISGNVPQFVRNTGLCEDLPCPILHTSVRNIYLLQPSISNTTDESFNPPLVGLAAPLKQSIQAEYRGLNMFDRLNMHAYIPTLGVVILASQKGRAIVLSLTRVSRSVKYPPELQGMGSKTNYAMRAECVLPLESEEKSDKRPFAPLHGIAVGPIQGTERKPLELRRWRLMMMYQDHSVLSYEIRKRREGEVTLTDLVV